MFDADYIIIAPRHHFTPLIWTGAQVCGKAVNQLAKTDSNEGFSSTSRKRTHIASLAQLT